VIRFVYPEAFLLGLAVVLLLRRRLVHPARLVTVLRVLLLALLCAVLAGPYVPGRTQGRDLILVVDVSRSVPRGGLKTVEETAELLRKQARAGDRIGMVTFGREAAVEAAQSADFRYAPPSRDVNRDGTDLAQAIRTGLALVPPGRQASLLVLSDGESTGADPAAAARDALRRGVRIDTILLRREGGFDLAVDELATPGEVGLGDPFQFSAWVRSEREFEAHVRLLRDGTVIADGSRKLQRGLNRLVFRDRLARQGIHRYEVAVETPPGERARDRIKENNRARAVVRVVGPFRVLCVTPKGREDRLTRSLRQAGIDIVVAAPRTAPLGLDRLDGFRAVVLENVAAIDLPQGTLAALARYVRDLGGGVLMTGGRASFGPGGYHNSALDDVLPVSMEIRKEQRKFSLAMAIALDRSGSMGMTVPTGQTKMDLANRGAAAAVQLLTSMDSIAVIAVDSVPHTVVQLTRATNRADIMSRIRKIEAGGGGIYTSTAIHACARQLSASAQSNRHIIVFADAADAEEPGDYKKFVPKLVKAGVTLSVIGLGTDRDPDAAFLKDLAKLGHGRVFFVADPADLPRVFAQETIQVARSSMVEEETALAVLPDIVAVGELLGKQVPTAGGYSIAYLRAGAQLGIQTRDDQAAPFFAFWQSGLGRSAAFLGEADGRLSGALAQWPGYADFFTTVVRWLAGNEASDDVYAELRREGHEAVLRVEVERGKEALLGQLDAKVLDPRGRPIDVVLRRVDERTLEARLPLQGDGVYRASLKVGDQRFLRVPPVTLPYSPEYEPRADPREGEKTLERIAAITEGRMDPTAKELLAGSRTGTGITFFGHLCALAAVFFLLLEIAVRRLGLRLPRIRVRFSLPKLAKRAKTREEPRPVAEEEAPKPEPAPEPPSEGITSILERAKAKRRRRR